MSKTLLEVASNDKTLFYNFVNTIVELNRKIKQNNVTQKETVANNRKVMEEEFEREYSQRKKKWHEWLDSDLIQSIDRDSAWRKFVRKKEKEGLKVHYVEEKLINCTENNYITYLANLHLDTRGELLLPYLDRINFDSICLN
jgi:hypothetical protein